MKTANRVHILKEIQALKRRLQMVEQQTAKLQKPTVLSPRHAFRQKYPQMKNTYPIPQMLCHLRRQSWQQGYGDLMPCKRGFPGMKDFALSHATICAVLSLAPQYGAI